MQNWCAPEAPAVAEVRRRLLGRQSANRFPSEFFDAVLNRVCRCWSGLSDASRGFPMRIGIFRSWSKFSNAGNNFPTLVVVFRSGSGPRRGIPTPVRAFRCWSGFSDADANAARGSVGKLCKRCVQNWRNAGYWTHKRRHSECIIKHVSPQ